MKYVVGFSGGVDSTAVVLKLLEEGHEVEAVTMDWIPEELPSHEYSQKVIKRACELAEKIGIKCRIIDVRMEFYQKVIEYFITTYLKGKTPNPCAMCNRFIKFGIFFEKATSDDSTYATGHYARIAKFQGKLTIRRGVEKRIEQSYFLAMVKPEVLRKVEFPLGGLTRSEVEKYVAEKGYKIEPKSQEICFINGNFWELISGKVRKRKNGWLIGPHGEKLREISDFYRYTIGQRKGLRVPYGKPLYVEKIDPESGNVYLTTAENLGWTFLSIKNCNWFIEPVAGKEYLIQIRYRTPPSPGRIVELNQDACLIKLDSKQVIVPGQIAAVYDGDYLAGGGIIEERWK